jgi:hypothetical protein
VERFLHPFAVILTILDAVAGYNNFISKKEECDEKRVYDGRVAGNPYHYCRHGLALAPPCFKNKSKSQSAPGGVLPPGHQDLAEDVLRKEREICVRDALGTVIKEGTYTFSVSSPTDTTFTATATNSDTKTTILNQDGTWSGTYAPLPSA